VSEEQDDLLEEWPFSNNFILAAILLLIAAAFTLAFRTEEQANQHAIWAYYSLVVGVFLRFIEIVLDERFDVELKPYTYRKLAPVKQKIIRVFQPVTGEIAKMFLPVKKKVVGLELIQRFSDRSESQENKDSEDEASESQDSGEENSTARDTLDKVTSLPGRAWMFVTSFRIVREVYVCEECGIRFTNQDDLGEHKTDIH